MEANSRMKFNIPIAEFTLKNKNYFYADPSSTIDFTSITEKVNFISNSEDIKSNIVDLGNVLFSKELMISVK